MTGPQAADRRTPLARVRGLGAAKEGVAQWWAQRVTAVLLIPLLLWFVVALIAHVGVDHVAVVAWLSYPVNYGLMLVLLAALFWHASLGFQVVLEDYLQSEGAKIVAILLAKGACLGLFVAGFVSLTVIAFAG